MRATTIMCAAVLFCAACAGRAQLSESSGVGTHPALPKPIHRPIPTINVVTAKGWTDGAMPAGAADRRVVAFARDLDHPRWLYVLPNGDVLVAETNAPSRPEA